MLNTHRFVSQKLKACFLRIVVKHLYGFERVFIQVFAHQLQFFQYIMGDRDDVAAEYSSAWKIFNNSRGLAQMSSMWGY